MPIIGHSDGLAFNSLAGDPKAGKVETHYLNTVSGEQAGLLPCKAIYAYNNTGVAVVSGGCYLLTKSGTESTPYVFGLVDAVSGVGYSNLAVFPEQNMAAATWGWVVCDGYAMCRVDGNTDVADGDGLGPLIGGGTGTQISLKKTTAVINRVGYACAARAANDENGLIRVNLQQRYISF